MTDPADSITNYTMAGANYSVNWTVSMMIPCF
jgi:hypothetical protein